MDDKERAKKLDGALREIGLSGVFEFDPVVYKGKEYSFFSIDPNSEDIFLGNTEENEDHPKEVKFNKINVTFKLISIKNDSCEDKKNFIRIEELIKDL